MKLSMIQKAFLALIVANIIWGAASPIFKLSLQNIPPFTLAFWRFLVAAILLIIILRSKAALNLKSQKDFFLLVGTAIAGITINIIFFFLGLQRTHAINAPIIASASPILTLIFALVILRERFSWKKFSGMILGTVGILVIIVEPLLQKGIDGSFIGNLLLLAATIGAVFGIILGRDLFSRYSGATLTLSLWTFIVGAATFLPLAAWEYFTSPMLYQSLDWRGWLGLGFGAIFSSAIAYSFYAWGLSKISATDTAMFTYIDPIAGSVLSVLILKEPVTGFFLLGSLLIFSGIGLAEGRLHYHPLHKLASPKTPLPPQGTKPIALERVNRSEVLQKIFKH